MTYSYYHVLSSSPRTCHIVRYIISRLTLAEDSQHIQRFTLALSTIFLEAGQPTVRRRRENEVRNLPGYAEVGKLNSQDPKLVAIIFLQAKEGLM